MCGWWHAVGWGCFQLGYGRKAEDPEPGRCRRTDGKKWRCSKEAYPDSKYCEKHMHRGKNRSRKPVEISLANSSSSSSSSTTITAPPTPSSSSSSSSSCSSSSSSSSSSSLSHGLSHYPSSLSISTAAPEPYHHLLYPYYGTRPPFHWDSSPYSADKDFRYGHGMMKDEYSFISEASGGGRESSWQFRPLGMSSLGDPKHGSDDQLFKEAEEEQAQQQQQQQHCFILGADFKLEKPAKTERAEHVEGQKPLRHFFDEWPPQKSKDSWMDLEGENTSLAYSKTQLSISIPMAHHDFSIAAPRYRNDE